MKNIIIWLAIILLATLVTYVSIKPTEKVQKIKTEVHLGAEESLLTAPIWIAEYKGFFEKNNLQVNIKIFDSGKASLVSLIDEDKLDICTVAQTPIMFNSFTERGFKILASMVTSTKDVKIIGRRDSGVINPEDLKGKKIGLTKGSTGEYFFNLILAKLNLSSSDVDIINIRPSGIPNALSRGQVDAVCIWEPLALKTQKKLKENAILLDVGEPYREDFYFVASHKLLHNDPDTTRRFLQSIQEAQKFIQKHEDESKKIVAKRLGLSLKDINALWNQYDYALMLDQTIIKTLESEAEWAITNGLTEHKKVPAYLNDFIYTDALEAVDSTLMQIVK